MNKIIAVLSIFILLGLANLGCSLKPNIESKQSPIPAAPLPNNKTAPLLASPLPRAGERVSKKPFGIKITPTHSPISPERFSGYHTGADFEIFPEEQDKDITVVAICRGQLLSKKYVTGYGGVVVQACELNQQAITVIYGHLKLSSIMPEPGSEIKAGSAIGVLGKGYSAETDQERQHLHLSIHKGSDINLLGYVKTPAELDDWFNPLDYLK